MSVFDAYFGGKRVVWVVNGRGKNELKFSDRLVYSALRVLRKGGTQKEIADLTGLSESGTVPRARDRLLALGLIRQVDGKLFSEAPPKQLQKWFSFKKGTEPEDDLLTAFRYLSPTKDCPLTASQLGVYFLLFSFAKGEDHVDDANAAGYASILSMDTATVSAAVEALVEAGLITIIEEHGRNWTIGLEQPDAEQLTWFADGIGNSKATKTAKANGLKAWKERLKRPITKVEIEEVADEEQVQEQEPAESTGMILPEEWEYIAASQQNRILQAAHDMGLRERAFLRHVEDKCQRVRDGDVRAGLLGRIILDDLTQAYGEQQQRDAAEAELERRCQYSARETAELRQRYMERVTQPQHDPNQAQEWTPTMAEARVVGLGYPEVTHDLLDRYESGDILRLLRTLPIGYLNSEKITLRTFLEMAEKTCRKTDAWIAEQAKPKPVVILKPVEPIEEAPVDRAARDAEFIARVKERNRMIREQYADLEV